MSEEQRGSGLGAGLAGLAVGGCFLGTWYLAVERPVENCGQYDSWCGLGGALLMYAVGTPVAYVLWSLGLRAAGVAIPWAAPFLIMPAVALLSIVTDSLEPPQGLWVVVIGALSACWARIPRLSPEPT